MQQPQKALDVVNALRSIPPMRGDMAEQGSICEAQSEVIRKSRITQIEEAKKAAFERYFKDVENPEEFERDCLGCGHEIPMVRIKAEKYALRCKDCVEKAENATAAATLSRRGPGRLY